MKIVSTAALLLSLAFQFVAADTGTFQLSPRRSLKNLAPVQDLAHLSNQIWAATPGGILVLDLKTKKWNVAWDEAGNLLANIHQISYQKPYLWAATEAGLFRIDAAKGEYLQFTTKDGLKADRVRLVSVDGASVWIGYANPHAGDEIYNEFTRLTRSGGVIRHWSMPEERDLIQLKADNGFVWLLSHDSISRLNQHTGKFETWTNENFPNMEKLNVEYSNLTVDTAFVYVAASLVEGNGRLLRFDKKTSKWTMLDKTFVFPIAKGNGLLWVGASYDLQNASRFVLKYIRDQEKEWKNEFYYENRVMFTDILPLKDSVWIGMTNGIMRWDPKVKEAVHYQVHDPLVSEYGSYVYSRYIGDAFCSDGSIYLSAGFLYRLQLNGNELSLPSQLGNIRGVSFMSISGNTMWAATNPKLYDNDGDEEEGDGYIYKLQIGDAQGKISKVKYPEGISNLIGYPWDKQIFLAPSEGKVWLGTKGKIGIPEGEFVENDSIVIVSTWTEKRGKRAGTFYDIQSLWMYEEGKWTALPDAARRLPGSIWAGLAVDGNLLYAATDSGLFFMKEKGSQWTKLYAGHISHFAASARLPLYFYFVAGQKLKVMRVDGGKVRTIWECPDSLNDVQKVIPHEKGVCVTGDQWVGIYDFEKGWRRIEVPDILKSICRHENGYLAVSKNDIYFIDPGVNPAKITRPFFPLDVREKQLKLHQMEKESPLRMELD